MPQLAEVLIPPLPQAYSYLIPDRLSVNITIGTRVTVPLGNRKAYGFVINTLEKSSAELPSEYKLKSVSEEELIQPAFYSEDLKFYEWVANYYCSNLSTVLETAIPNFVKPKLETELFVDTSQVTKKSWGPIQNKVIALVSNNPGIKVSQVQQSIPKALNSIRRLLELGVLEANTIAIHELANHTGDISWAKKSVALCPNQIKALEKVNKSISTQEFKPHLLFGVTGSGKTEVYIEAVKNCLHQGLGALIIVPEIALTPQLIDRFVARLGHNIAVLHSGLNKNIRWNSWLALLEQRSQIAIGARSAIFAPVHNLGLIIVDEEHDHSYKQAEGLRYNARDLAVARAKLFSCPVILGSATPSLESYAHAKSGRYELLSLPDRPSGTNKLEIQLIDRNKVKFKDLATPSITQQLFELLEKTIKAGEQAFIMYNKRGFASYLQCEICSEVLMCSHCNVTLTYHQKIASAHCHYCGYRVKPPEFCLTCSQKPEHLQEQLLGKSLPRYELRGAGTEKVADELRELFPRVNIDRLDRDVVNSFHEYRKILDRVRNRETQILVGTQMIAKGHDLPGVTLVGVIDCDVGIHFPDFRAGERVFQLMTQVAGRAGRADLPGYVVLQTRVPSSSCLKNVLNQDYHSFAMEELLERKRLGYPPFARILRIICSANVQSRALDYSKILFQEIKKIKAAEKLKIEILGPTEAPLTKLRMFWRYHLIIKATSHSNLQKIIARLKPQLPRDKTLRIAFDLDPLDLL